MTLDEVKQHIPEDIKDIVETKIAAETKSYENGIDVADGGAYITANMCENLLRMNGKWSKDIERAFKILKSSTKEHLTPKEMLSIADFTTLFCTGLVEVVDSSESIVISL